MTVEEFVAEVSKLRWMTGIEVKTRLPSTVYDDGGFFRSEKMGWYHHFPHGRITIHETGEFEVCMLAQKEHLYESISDGWDYETALAWLSATTRNSTWGDERGI